MSSVAVGPSPAQIHLNDALMVVLRVVVDAKDSDGQLCSTIFMDLPKDYPVCIGALLRLCFAPGLCSLGACLGRCSNTTKSLPGRWRSTSSSTA